MLLNKFEKKQSLCFANCRVLQPIAQPSRDEKPITQISTYFTNHDLIS
jgi:hypothetical protein